MESQGSRPTWTPEAEARLARAPAFLQGMVRKLTERRAREQGVSVIDEAFLAETRDRMMGGTPAQPGASWTREARERLQQVPAFLRDAVQRIAEEAAAEEGAVLVTAELLDRLERAGDALSAGPGESLPWTREALALLEKRLAGTPALARDFVRETLKQELEAQARGMGLDRVDEAALRRILEAARQHPVEWEPEARARLDRAPEFVREGIRKAAEKRARMLGVTRITSPLLTQLRNAAMMKAVRRIRKLGYRELTFDAFDAATESIPRLRTPEARKRLQDIRDYMARRGEVHLLDPELMARFREYLKGEGDL